MLRRILSCAAVLLHCGGGDPSSAPQVHDYGGPVLGHPTVVPVFFQGDVEQPRIEAFLAQLAASPYWTSVTAEYGVGALSIAPSVVLTDAPPATIAFSEIESGLAARMPVVRDQVYAVFYPAQTTILDANGDASCVRFGGFHGEARTASGDGIVYVAMPRCDRQGDLEGLDALTAPLSHELVEAATDPFVRTHPAYAAVDSAHTVWNVMPLGEVADMCSYASRSYQRFVGSFMVQRVWSNAAASAGHDPCVPAFGDPYFVAVPVLTETPTLAYRGQEISTRGVSVPLGASRTIDVRLLADGPVEDWTVNAVDTAVLSNEPAQLSFAWDVQRGNAGDTLHLTITRLADGPYRGSEIVLYAQRGDASNGWYAFVGN